jgi:hypothetical protein
MSLLNLSAQETNTVQMHKELTMRHAVGKYPAYELTYGLEGMTELNNDWIRQILWILASRHIKNREIRRYMNHEPLHTC